MDARLDPECQAAGQLSQKHSQQEIALTGGSEGQLATILRNTHDRQIMAHIGGCALCSSYRTAFCAECQFDLRKQKHGWRCSKGPRSWTDFLPWNIRARKAPARPSANAPLRAPRDAPAGPRGTVPPTPRPAARPIPHRRAVSPPAAKPSPSPLAAAYAVLGVTSAATPDQVRKAFRERAQQYHPDKVAHMAPEFRAVAEQKMKELNDAYERVKKSQ